MTLLYHGCRRVYLPDMQTLLPIDWQSQLAPEFQKPYFISLTTDVTTAYQTDVIYPPLPDVFTAFTLTPFSTLQVVILGQDPYHTTGQAHGLAFSVPDGVALPPSLRNIYSEIRRDTNTTPPSSGNLTRWATQGVLLLNSTLTVRSGQAGSHQKFGWEVFTDAVIRTIAAHHEHVVFLLWGARAIAKQSIIDETKHLILTAPHPSPLSAHRGFFGCGHFTATNCYLSDHTKTPINW